MWVCVCVCVRVCVLESVCEKINGKLLRKTLRNIELDLFGQNFSQRIWKTGICQIVDWNEQFRVSRKAIDDCRLSTRECFLNSLVVLYLFYLVIKLFVLVWFSAQFMWPSLKQSDHIPFMHALHCSIFLKSLHWLISPKILFQNPPHWGKRMSKW